MKEKTAIQAMKWGLKKNIPNPAERLNYIDALIDDFGARITC